MPPASRGSRRDFAALEARRYEAARLFTRGTSQVTVARTLGVTRAAAHRWYHAWQDEGRTALKAAGRPPHVGPARPPPGLDSHGRELDALVDRGGPGLPLGRPAPALLLPDAARQLQRSRADRLPARAQAALPGPLHHRGVGRAGGAHEPRDAAVSRARPSLADGRAPAGLRPRTESRRADLGQHQGARTCQPLPGRHPRTPRAPARRLRPHSWAIDAGLQLLATRRTVVLTCSLPYFTRLIRGPPPVARVGRGTG